MQCSLSGQIVTLSERDDLFLSINCDLSILNKRQPVGNQSSKTAMANDQMDSYILAHRAVDYNAVVAILRQLKKHQIAQVTYCIDES